MNGYSRTNEPSGRRGNGNKMTATTAAAAVSEEDIEQLRKLGIDEVRRMIRPDTTGITLAFDAMMSKVKRRGARLRHQDTSKAIEWCFAPFAGRGKTSVGVREFAKRLSVLSMEWSGNFSREEYLALAHIVAEEDNPGVITLGSFKRAAVLGSVALAAPARLRIGGYAQGNYGRGGVGHGVGQIEGVLVDGGVGDSTVKRPENEESAAVGGGRGGEEEEEGGDGSATFSRDPVEATLRRAASEARSAGHDVSRLLDISVLENPENESVETIPESEREINEARGSPPLTSEALRRFFAELNVRIIAPSSPNLIGNFAITEKTVAVARTENGLVRRINAGELVTPPFFPPPPPPPSSLSAGVRKGGAEALWMSMPRPKGSTITGRYTCAVSRSTASVRCRMHFFNRELARTRDEAEVLISQAVKTWEFDPSFPEDSGEEGAEGMGGEDHRDSPPSQNSHTTKGEMSAGGIFDGRESTSGMIEVCTGGSVRGLKFSRISPVHRPDAGHPRVDIKPRSPPREGSIGGAKLPRSGLVADSTDQEQRYRDEDTFDSDGKDGSGDCSVGSIGGTEKVKGLSAALLAAALEAEKASMNASAGSMRLNDEQSAGLDGRGRATVVGNSSDCQAGTTKPRPPPPLPKSTFREARFDPPSVRNGLRGLTMEHVDEMLFRVEESLPGSKTCWKYPERARRSGTRGITKAETALPIATPIDVARERKRREKTRGFVMGKCDAQMPSSVASDWDQSIRSRWERMRRVIRTPATARQLSASRKNVWHRDRMKWVGPRDN